MKNILKVAILTTLSFNVLNFGAFAAEPKPEPKHQDAANLADSDNYEKVKEEFRAFTNSVKPVIKDEIKTFRSKMQDFNKQKSDLYKALSQEAQDVLKKENGFKKKLPWKQRKELMKDVHGDEQNSGKKDIPAFKPATPAAPQVAPATAK